MPKKIDEQVSTISTWKKCASIQIDLPLVGRPFVTLFEEVATDAPGQPERVPARRLNFALVANEPFPLIDPDTGIPTGQSMTGDEIFRAVYAIYLKKMV